MATSFNQVAIGAADRKDDVIRVELWRTVSAVGNWMAILRNTDGQYNGVFDVQDQFLIDVDAPAATLMQGRVDGPDAVMLRGRDLESDWDEYTIIRGVDQAQDLLFHNDFEHFYPDTAQQVKAVWNDVINIQLAAATNITYAPPVGATPIVGAFEFREGTSVLTATQELFRRAGFIFYVDDVLAFQSGAPGFSASAEILTSVAGDANNNILDIVDFVEREGDKHYNYIRLYGKNPMFDGYTEYNVIGAPWLVGWHPWQLVLAGQMANDTNTVRVGSYSIVAWNNNPVNQHVRLYYTLPYYNYTAFDFTSGELGVWCLYDDTAGDPGAPGAGSMGAGAVNLYVRLTDGAARTGDYYGTSTVLYRGDWGYCTFPLGEGGDSVAGAPNQWFLSNPAFDWSDIRDIYFSVRPAGGFAAANYPSHVYLDGISMPEPCIAVTQNAAQQLIYLRRPYVDYFTDIRTQNALDTKAIQFLTQHESTLIDKVKLVTEGNINLRYAGQSVTVNIPSLGLNNAVMYMTQIHHIIEPYSDVSDGFGFDWITEIEAVPTSGVGYDMSRLRIGPSYSAKQLAARIATGQKNK